MLIAFLMRTVAVEKLDVIATFNTTLPNHDKMLAEQIEKPFDISSDSFAAHLVEAQCLTSWNPQDPLVQSPVRYYLQCTSGDWSDKFFALSSIAVGVPPKLRDG